MVLRNTVWNTAGLAAEMATGFLLAPFLVHQMGKTAYGAWLVLGSVVACLGLMDLGVRVAVGRLVAAHRAKGDADRVSETMACGLVVLGGLGAVALVAGVVASWGFVDTFNVPEELAGDAAGALALLGAALAVTLALNPFDAALWACQRFDRLNQVDIPAAVLRAVAMVLVVRAGGGLTGLAAVTLAAAAAAGAAKTALAVRALPGLRLGPGRVTRRAARELTGFSAWVLGGTALRVARGQVGPLLIARLVGVAAVGPFGLAGRLGNVPASVLAAVTGVTAPASTRLFALGERDQLRRLFVTHGRYTFALAGFMAGGLVVLGGPLTALWLGPDLGAAVVGLLVILAAGELAANTQAMSRSLYLAAGYFRWLTYLSAAELAALGVLAAVLVPAAGAVGMCLALVLPGAVFQGAVPLVLGCRLTGLSVAGYLRAVAAPAALAAAAPAGLLAAAVWAHEPATWAELAAYAAGYGAAFAASGLACFPDARAHPAVARVLRAAWPGGRGVGRPVG